MNTYSPAVPKIRERLREETSAVILAAAEAVIGEDGLHAARMEKIAQRAGVAVGTVYNHFKDRAALLEALRNARVANLQEVLAETLTPLRDRPAREQVQALLASMVVHGRRHGRLFAAMMQEHQGPSRLRPPLQARTELAKRAREIVEHGVARGEFREDAASAFVEALVALARLVLAQSIEGSDSDAGVSALAEFFVRGVAR